MDNTMLFLINNRRDFAWRRSELFIVEEKRAEPIIQSPILGSDAGRHSCGRGVLLPFKDAFSRLLGRGSERPCRQVAVNRRSFILRICAARDRCKKASAKQELQS